MVVTNVKVTAYPKLNEDLGARIISILESNHPAVKSHIINLRKIFSDIQPEYGKNMAVLLAYTGCIFESLSGNDPVPKLTAYVKALEKTLKRNPFQDPEVFIPRIYAESFY